MDTFDTAPGSAHPLGITTYPDGVNFSLFSQAATDVLLLLFDSATASRADADRPARSVPEQDVPFLARLCSRLRTGHLLRVPRRWAGDPAAGQRFNPNKVLIGPYARGICKDLWNRADAIGPQDNIATSMRCAVVDPAAYDWEGDQPLKRPIHESIIYEVHVGGFTRSPSSGVAHPGTFAGMIEKIPYLQALGVTAVELLPVFEFDDYERVGEPGGRPDSQLLGL